MSRNQAELNHGLHSAESRNQKELNHKERKKCKEEWFLAVFGGMDSH
jgi:hypothetical protein